MRQYSIKRGHHPDINMLLKKYFDVEGDVEAGVEFYYEGVGKISIKKVKNNLVVDIVPPEKPSDDYSIIKKWNDFLYEATGRTAKERRKLMEKETIKE